MSSSAPAALHYPFGDALPAPGHTLEVAPGVHWLRMRLPFALDHINLWLLRGTTGWTVVDAGIDNPGTRADWQAVLGSTLQGLPIELVLITHLHPDHVGCAQWLCQTWQAPLAMHPVEYRIAADNLGGSNSFGTEEGVAFYRAHGWPLDGLEALRARKSEYPKMVPGLPPLAQPLAPGMVLHMGGRDWTCRLGLGHSPAHIALHAAADSLMISGDMLLPSISSNVSVWPSEPDADPLAGFLNSLRAMEDLAPDTLVLPSHGRPFVGALGRLAQLQAHHAQRLEALRGACAQAPRTAVELLPVLFERALNAQQMTFAVGEAVAHLNHLWHAGDVRRERDAQGCWRFGA